MASGAALTPALMTLRVMGTIRAYVSAKHCGLSLVLSKEIRATTIGSCVDRTMGISAGAGPGTGWRMLPQLGQGARVPEGPGQRLASDHRRPLEAESGKIVRGSTERSFAWAARFRRLVKDYERYAGTLADLPVIAFVRLMLRQAVQRAAGA